MKKTLTQKRLKELVYYNKEDGSFTSLVDWKRYCKKGDKIGRPASTGYTVISIDYKQYLAHRLAWFYEYNEWPKVIDHINHDKTDNKLSNIRNVSHSVNSKNYPSRRSINTSGARGVHWNKNSEKWTACIGVDYKTIHLGSFETKLDAFSARVEAENKYGFTIKGE